MAAAADPAGRPAAPAPRRTLARGALALGALGVVFGDIGTSPLYTVQTLFNPDDPHPVAIAKANVFGGISLIFWAVVMVVTVQYVVLVMRADNDGEGGIMALIALIKRRVRSGSARTKAALAALGIFGASLFFGDSMITPAMSVLSAVQGLEVIEPSLDVLIVPVTAAILVGLFLLQRVGTATVGRLFGPVMLVWFAAIAVVGIHGIGKEPAVLEALLPTYGLEFLFSSGGTGFFALAAVVLAVTGAEALYADMGHFGAGPIRRAWLFVVFPACILSYLGQGALVLDDPGAARGNPFFELVPGWGQIAMLILATAATVIASQAVITGTFSLVRQAIQLGYLPRLRIEYTSHEVGQIYVPWVNWALLVAVLTLVFTFESSTKLAYAFGMAVTATISITAILFFYFVRRQWQAPLWLVLGGAVIILAVDLAFFAANLTKVLHGAWLPLIVGLVMYAVLSTWQRGQRIVTAERERREGDLRAFVAALPTLDPPPARVPGTAIFLNRATATAPLALRANVERNHALHERVVIVSLDTRPVPYVDDAERLSVDHLGPADDDICLLNAAFGFRETPDVPRVLALAARQGVLESPVDLDDATYFLSKIEIRASHAPELARWRKHLFQATARIASDAADYFNLPRERTVVMGSRLEF